MSWLVTEGTMKLPVIVSGFTVVGVLTNTIGVQVTPNTIYVIVCPVKLKDLSKSDENPPFM